MTAACLDEVHSAKLKYARPTLDAAALGAELIVDSERYGARPDVTHLVWLVFDRDVLLANPRGLERDLSRVASAEGTTVTIFILDR